MDLANFVNDGSGKKKKILQEQEAFYHELLELQGAFTALEKCRMPTIAVIQGAWLEAPLIWLLLVICVI